MNKLTRAERLALCHHTDPDIRDYLTAVETGRIGVIYEGGRGASIEPRRDATLRSYSGTMGRLAAYLDGKPWTDVSETDLETFLEQQLRNGGDRSISTATQHRSAIRGFYKYLMAYQRVEYRRPDDNPAAFVRLDADKLRRPHERQPVTDPQWLAVMGCASLTFDDRLALGLGYYVGLRREEIVTVAPHAVDPLHRRILFVNRKGGKTKSGLEYGELVGLLCDERPEVADGAADWLELVEMYARLRNGETTLVPGGNVRHAGQRFNDRLEHRILPAAGLEPKAFTPHNLRHSFGTNMALCGLDVTTIADQMSHSSTDTTARYINMAGQIAAFRKRTRTATSTEMTPVITLAREARNG